MQEPLGTMHRPVDPVPERRDDVNMHNTSTTPRSDRGFGATFAIAAAVLLVAFLVALYLGMSGPDSTLVPDVNGQSSTIETIPDASNQATGSDTTTTIPPAPTDTTGGVPAPGGATGTTGATGTSNQ